MSHFTVLVSIKDETESALEKALQPFHEYECTGIKDEFVKFVACDETEKELRIEFESCDDGDYDDFEEFIKDYYGYEMVDGVIGGYTNPDRKWDWWVVGGRWSNSLITKSGKVCDSAKKSDIDFDAMMKRSVDANLPDFDKAVEIIGGETFKSWDEVRSIDGKDMQWKREFYNGQSAVKKLRIKFDNPFCSLDQFLSSREDYIKSMEFSGISMFAVLHDGNWIEKGDMGWWGCVSDEKKPSEWREVYMKAIDQIPDDHTLVVVDCHI
jgi:hypothetical protein